MNPRVGFLLDAHVLRSAFVCTRTLLRTRPHPLVFRVFLCFLLLAFTSWVWRHPSTLQSYLESRSTAVQEVEGHIAELGLIFNKLATMLQDQREMVERYASVVPRVCV